VLTARASVSRVDRATLTGRAQLDPESRAWIDELKGAGPSYDAAVERLRELLLRAARFELSRRRGQLANLRHPDIGDVAEQAADDACVAVLAHLDDFRGASRFSTWAYKFALLEAATKVRRLAWRGREVPLEPDAWARVPGGVSPSENAERSELLSAIRDAIASELTSHQRDVLTALALNEVPIDVLAERLTTTRGALYKTLHDARRKLRRYLDDQGLALESWLEETS
jgi:RNA polymerase sigma-70 factor (ECF subfamily)